MIDGAWLVLRAAGLVLTLQAAGAGLFAVGFGRRLGRAAQAIERAGLRAVRLALGVSLAQGLFEPVYLAGDASGAIDPTLLRLFLHSSVAAEWAMRVAGLTLVAVGLPRAAVGPRARALVLAGSVATVGSFLLSGHTSVDPQRPLLAPLLLAHLAIVAFWFGALWPLRQLTGLEAPALAARAIATFSAVAIWLVPVIALAGVGMAVLLLPDVAALGQPYGRLLLGKLGLFAVLMGVAALNRLRLAPALARGEAGAPRALRRSLALEYGLICAALVVTAVMTGSFSPADSGRVAEGAAALQPRSAGARMMAARTAASGACASSRTALPSGSTPSWRHSAMRSGVTGVSFICA
jgi:putative copper export protein